MEPVLLAHISQATIILNAASASSEREYLPTAGGLCGGKSG
jgi:hypothetical protein